MNNYIIAKNKYGQYAVPRSSTYTYTSRAILAGDVHEPQTIEYLQKKLQLGDIIHAGTCYGDFLPALKGQNTVYTFEPNPENYKAALATININSLNNIKIFNFGLSDKKQNKMLKTKDGNLGMGPRSEVNDLGDTEILVDKLDNIIKTPISAIHLDIEGYEFAALLGGREIIKKYRPDIILEIDERAVDYNDFMEKEFNYFPSEHLIYNAGPMVFVNTVYKCQ